LPETTRKHEHGEFDRKKQTRTHQKRGKILGKLGAKARQILDLQFGTDRVKHENKVAFVQLTRLGQV
jgi:hypothetical protein